MPYELLLRHIRQAAIEIQRLAIMIGNGEASKPKASNPAASLPQKARPAARRRLMDRQQTAHWAERRVACCALDRRLRVCPYTPLQVHTLCTLSGLHAYPASTAFEQTRPTGPLTLYVN